MGNQQEHDFEYQINASDSVDMATGMLALEKVLTNHGADAVVYEMNGFDLAILHGMICMASEHPGFQKSVSDKSREVADRFRAFCKDLWIRQGLTEEQAAILDNIRMIIND